jgi:hypothetical protein
MEYNKEVDLLTDTVNHHLIKIKILDNLNIKTCNLLVWKKYYRKNYFLNALFKMDKNELLQYRHFNKNGI